MTNRHDQEIGKLYREGGADEPPAALDHAILKTARESVAPVRKEKPWWLRFAMPLQLAFSAVLVAMLALLVDRHPPESSSETARPPRQAPAGSLETAPPVADSVAARVPAAASADKARSLNTPRREPAPTAPRLDMKAETAAAPTPGERASTAKAGAPAAAESFSAPQLDAVKPGAVPSTGAPVANRIRGGKNPADWLTAIERLAASGDKTAALNELESFRKAYPDYPLPPALEKLLAP